MKLNRLIFIIFCAIFPIYSFPQTNKKEKEEKVDKLLESADQAQLEVNIINIIKYANEALAESENINYSKGKASACMLIATGLYDLGKYNDALRYLSKGEREEFTKTSYILLAEFQRIRGRVYGEMGLKKASVEAFRKGIEFSEKIPNKIYKARVQNLAYQNLVINYKLEKKFDSMYLYIKKSESLLKSLDEKIAYQDLVNFYSDYSTYYTLKNNLDSADYFFSKGINLAKKYKFPYTSSLNTEKGKIEIKKNKPNSALEYYFRALKNAQENDLKTDIIEINELISKVYLQKGDTIHSNAYKLKALNLEKELNMEIKKASDFVINEILTNDNKHFDNIKRLQITIFIVFTTLITIGSIIFFKIKKNNKRLLFTKEKILQEKLNESFAELVYLAKEKSPEFLTRFREVYPEFINKLLNINPNLRSSELTFCAYIFLNFSTKDIAKYTFTSSRTVQNRKNNIRKKLQISSQKDLYLWMNNITK